MTNSPESLSARPHNPHGSLDFTSRPLPSAFEACLAVVHAFDDVSDETLANIVRDGVRSDVPQVWPALQVARAVCRAEGYLA